MTLYLRSTTMPIIPPRIAVLGGSFDPPHLGHRAIVQYLLDKDVVDKVLIVPSYDHPLKTNGAVASYGQRLLMCWDALVEPFGDKVSLSTVEMVIGDGRTYNVLHALESMLGDVNLMMVVGVDILQERDRWYRWDSIRRRWGFLYFARDGYSCPVGTHASTHTHISSTRIRNALARGESVADQIPSAILPLAQSIYSPQGAP